MHQRMFKIGLDDVLTSILILCTLGLVGCSSVSGIHGVEKATYSHANTILENATELKPADLENQPARIVRSAFPYVNTIAVAKEQKLPAIFNNMVTLNTPGEDVWSLLGEMSKLIGVKIVADDDLTDLSARTGSSISGKVPPPPTGTVDATLVSTAASGSTLANGAARASLGPVLFHGTGWDAIEHVANMLDASAKYDASSGTVHIFRYETKVFHIDQVAGDMTASLSMASDDGTDIQGSTGQTTHAGGSGGDSIGWSSKAKFWDKLSDSLALLRSPVGSAVVNEAMSQVVVHDRYDHMPQIQSYIDSVNGALATEVTVKITVYRITDNDSDNRGISWSALYNSASQLADKAGATLTTAESSVEGLSQFVISAPTTTKSGATSLFSGSEFFLQMLNTVGHAVVEDTATIPTTNNVAASSKSVALTTYLAQTTSLYTSGTTTSTSSAVGAGATLTPGSVETGFTAVVVPSIDPDGHRLLLRGKVSLSTLDSMNTYTSGGNSIQEPQISVRRFWPNKWLKSGETLVVAGFAGDSASNKTTSPTSQSLWMLAGNRDLTHARDLIVVAITPVISSPQVML